MNNLGIIAGSGDFPLLVAKGARSMGHKQIVVAALIGETKKDIEMLADIVVWIELNQLKEIVHCFKKNGCTSVAFAGQITPTKLFSQLKLDLRLAEAMVNVEYRGAGPYFGKIAKELAIDGINIIDSTSFVKDHLARAGVMTKNKPSKELQGDIEKGYQLAKQIAEYGIGKTLVMKEGTLVSVEAIEGTNKTIERAGELAGSDTIVFKVAGSTAEKKLSIPVVGIETIKVMKDAKASVLVLDKLSTIMLNLKEVVKFSEQNNIAIVGM